MKTTSSGGGPVHSGAQARLEIQYRTAQALAESATFAQAIPEVLRAVCETMGWEHGAFWTVDRDAVVLRCAGTWRTPPLQFREFEALSLSTTFARGTGLPGRVWASGSPAWIEDVTQDSNFPRAAAASREGLHGAFGFPVTRSDEVLGVMEFFSRRIRRPDTEVLQLFGAIGSQVGQFLERLRTEEELDRFFTLALDMFCIAGFDGYFKRINASWEKALGFTPDELLARPYIDFVHPEDRAGTVQAASRLAEGAELVSFENRYRCKDGSYRWLLWAAAPAAGQGRIYATAHDMTERKRSEEDLRRYASEMEVARRAQEENAERLFQLVKELEAARQRAEEATRAKGEFLANMSHEIRTPMSAIMGMTDLALGTRLTRDQRDYLTTVKDAAESLLALIDDILDFSKIEARKLDLEHVEFDLRDVVEGCVKVLAGRAHARGLELACRVEPSAPETVVGDPGRLRQILVNLLGNAIKFTEKGEVVLTVELEGIRDGETHLRFAVTDTGIGIPEEKQALIFDAFAQADASTTRRYGGTGLGLAISSQLARMMGGRIQLDSRPGRGSTFAFTAALGLARRERRRTALPPRTALRGVEALIVDDSATNRRILAEVLSGWGMKPVPADGPEAALGALAKRRGGSGARRVVLLDAVMPGMDGLALARRIRKDRRIRQPAIVMLTSAVSPPSAAQLKGARIASCITKPVRRSDLLDAIAGALGPGAATAAAESLASRSRKAARRPARPLRILVVEDNAVNRKLVARLLERGGHRVSVAVDGSGAVAQARDVAPDLILMDVQMPVMDGLAAAAAIREREKATGRHVPIVAMTASAMRGDRERCLEAGMDDYIAKPIRPADLLKVVERAASPASRTARLASVDEKRLLSGVGGDAGLLREMAGLFLRESPALVTRIDRAIRKGDASALAQAAHALKGSAGAFSRGRVYESAKSLETMGRRGNLSGARDVFGTLRLAMDRLVQELTVLRTRLRRQGAARRGRADRWGRT